MLSTVHDKCLKFDTAFLKHPVPKDKEEKKIVAHTIRARARSLKIFRGAAPRNGDEEEEEELAVPCGSFPSCTRFSPLVDDLGVIVPGQGLPRERRGHRCSLAHPT